MIPGIARAQTAPAAQPAEVEQSDIVVTAQRRSETAQRVPASIVAASGDALERAGISTASQLSQIVPNLNTYSPFGEGSSPVFVMRGITANDYSPSQSHPVALYVNDGLRGSSALEVVQLYDINRVETLRGPQGTLYGKNATGGAINVITNAPQFGVTGGNVSLGYGSFNRVEARGAAQTTIVDDILAARLAFQYVHDDGLIANKQPGAPRLDQTDTLGVRLTVAFRPSDDLDFTLRAFHSRVGGQGPSLYPRDIQPFLGVSRQGLGFYETRTDYNPERNIKDTGLNLNSVYKIGPNLTLTSITTFDRANQDEAGDYDGTESHIDHITVKADDISQFVEELRLAGTIGKLTLTGGGLYGSDSMRVSNDYAFVGDSRLGIPFNPSAFGVPYSGPQLWGFAERNSFIQKRYSYAVYTRAELALTDAFNVFGGIRYSHDTVKALNYTAAIGGTIDTKLPLETGAEWQYPVPTFAGVDKEQSFHNVSVEAGANYRVAPDILAYASFKQGYRTGAISAQAFITASEITIVKPETVNAYEVGLKTQFWNKAATLNLSAFFNDYKNQQFLNTEGSLIILRNAEKSRIWGFEAEGNVRINDALRINAGLGWLDPKFVRATLTPANPAAGDISGNQLIGANRFSTSVGLDWTLLRTAKTALRMNLDASYRSRTYYQADNAINLAQPGYWLGNGRLAWNNGAFEVALWAKNIFGKKYFVSSFEFVNAVGLNEQNRGPRRQIGVETSIKF